MRNESDFAIPVSLSIKNKTKHSKNRVGYIAPMKALKDK